MYLIRGSSRTNIKDWAADESPATDLHSGDHILVGRKSWLELNIIPFAGLAMSGVSLLIYIKQSLNK